MKKYKIKNDLRLPMCRCGTRTYKTIFLEDINFHCPICDSCLEKRKKQKITNKTILERKKL